MVLDELAHVELTMIDDDVLHGAVLWVEGLYAMGLAGRDVGLAGRDVAPRPSSRSPSRRESAEIKHQKHRVTKITEN